MSSWFQRVQFVQQGELAEHISCGGKPVVRQMQDAVFFAIPMECYCLHSGRVSRFKEVSRNFLKDVPRAVHHHSPR